MSFVQFCCEGHSYLVNNLCQQSYRLADWNCDAQAEGGGRVMSMMRMLIILFSKNHLSLLWHFLCCLKRNKNNHAALIPVRAECNELTTSKRKRPVPSTSH
eukprot:scaffold10182_cov144-Chaetoceros_neogracile.AAC.2